MPVSRFEFRLRSSKRLFLAVLTGHLLALMAILLSQLTGAWRVAGILLVLASWFWQEQQNRRPAVDELVCLGGQWTLSRAGTRQDAELAGHWHSPWLAVLNFRLHDGRRVNVPVWPDMMPASDWRTLSWLLRGFLDPERP